MNRNRFQRSNREDSAPSAKRRELLKEGIDQELSIDDMNLNRELMDQALYFRKYTKELSKVQRKAKSIKAELERTEARLYVRLSNDGKGRKVKEIESMVMLDESVSELREQLLEAEELQTEYEGIVKAFYQRHEMLKDLCANARRDMVD